MKLYHCSYTNNNSFVTYGRIYEDKDIDGSKMGVKRVSLSGDPFKGLRGFVDAIVLEYARLKKEKLLTVYVYECDVNESDVILPEQLHGKIFDIDVTNEHWYIGSHGVTMYNIGKIDISTDLRNRSVVEYNDYGLSGEIAKRVYGDKMKFSEHVTLRGRSRKLRRGVNESPQDTLMQKHHGQYLKVRIDHEYVKDMDNFVWANPKTFAYTMFSLSPMNYELIRLKAMQPIRIELLLYDGYLLHRDDEALEEDSVLVNKRYCILDKYPNKRKIISKKDRDYINPSLTYINES